MPTGMELQQLTGILREGDGPVRIHFTSKQSDPRSDRLSSFVELFICCLKTFV